jgi:hypothetical protein
MAKKDMDYPNTSTVIIDRELQHPENPEVTLRFTGDLEFLLSDVEDYAAKLREGRRIPQNTDTIMPDDWILEAIESLPEIQKLPKITRTEATARNKTILELARSYYTQQERVVMSDALILALTIDNDLTEEPSPYEKSKMRARPGLPTLPEIQRDLTNPVERRLKQVMDRLLQIPGALGQVRDMTDTLTVEMRSLMQRDRDGFRNR